MMSDTMVSLRRKIGGAGDLQSVVRTMKALAASSIGQYEQSVSALADYARTVELGLSVCFREDPPMALLGEQQRQAPAGAIGAVVFGSDQGLVGQFNEVVVDYAVKTLAALPGRPRIWAVGERVQARLVDAGLEMLGFFPVPNSVKAITPLVGQILLESETHRSQGEIANLHLFYNRPTSRAVYANISSSRSSGPAPSLWPAKTPAAWRQCNGPKKTSTNCWKTSIGTFTSCAKPELTRNCSTSSPALRR
jgi:F-type H+-transporting ATPase subunit gamma